MAYLIYFSVLKMQVLAGAFYFTDFTLAGFLFSFFKIEYSASARWVYSWDL